MSTAPEVLRFRCREPRAGAVCEAAQKWDGVEAVGMVPPSSSSRGGGGVQVEAFLRCRAGADVAELEAALSRLEGVALVKPRSAPPPPLPPTSAAPTAATAAAKTKTPSALAGDYFRYDPYNVSHHQAQRPESQQQQQQSRGGGGVGMRGRGGFGGRGRRGGAADGDAAVVQRHGGDVAQPRDANARRRRRPFESTAAAAAASGAPVASDGALVPLGTFDQRQQHHQEAAAAALGPPRPRTYFYGGVPIPPMPPARVLEGFAAVLDHVPFNTTNAQLAQLLSGAGHIFDINRSEHMATVYFDSPEAVTNAICLLNGKRIKDSIIVVSNGGRLRMPVPAPVPLPMATAMPPTPLPLSLPPPPPPPPARAAAEPSAADVVPL